MTQDFQTDSRQMLGRLRAVMAEDAAGQQRLDRITTLIAEEMHVEVCSIYLFRDEDTLELCATEGLNPEAVHETRMKLGEGLVGRVARTGQIINTADAPGTRGFRYMAETGEEAYSGFLGVPVQRLGEMLGVVVVQTKRARSFSDDEVYALEVVAMVIAEMAELGAFVGEGAAMSGCTSRGSWSPIRSPTIHTANWNACKTRSRICASASTVCCPPQRAATRNSFRCSKRIGCSPIPRAGCAAWRRISAAACPPRLPWKRNNPPPAPGWGKSVIPTCANACMIWMTCRTDCCAS